MGDAFPLVTLFGAVAAAAWLAGFRVAIPVALIGYLACLYLFIPPRGNFDLDSVDNQVGFVAYLFICGLISRFPKSRGLLTRGRLSGAKFSESHCEVSETR
jgi:K+-sensing histidine kinase KdpD